MLKKSLFISTFFLLFIGLSDYGYGCHRDVPHGAHTCPDETDPPAPGGGEDAEYSVAISGAVEGGGGLPWILGRGGKAIDADWRGLGGLTDLSFFTRSADLGTPTNGGPFEDSRGLNCFGIIGADFDPQAGIRKGRGGRADTSFWFRGETAVGGTSVLYLLSGFGEFINPWPPILVGDVTTLAINEWELTVEGEGNIVNNLSCIGKGLFADYQNDGDGLMIIKVKRTN